MNELSCMFIFKLSILVCFSFFSACCFTDSFPDLYEHSHSQETVSWQSLMIALYIFTETEKQNKTNYQLCFTR